MEGEGTFLDKSYGLCLQVPYLTTRRKNNWLAVVMNQTTTLTLYTMWL